MGFLPCGLVYSALALALTSAKPLTASTTMLAFGLGTLPMMLLAGSTAGTSSKTSATWLAHR